MTDNYIKRDNVYKAYEKLIVSSVNNTLDQLIMGEEVDQYTSATNMYHLMLQIGWEGYVKMTKEDIKCMSESLFCLGTYPADMNRIYQSGWGSSNPDYDHDDPHNPDGKSKDGIDFMQIKSSGVKYPINRIK